MASEQFDSMAYGTGQASSKPPPVNNKRLRDDFWKNEPTVIEPGIGSTRNPRPTTRSYATPYTINSFKDTFGKNLGDASRSTFQHSTPPAKKRRLELKDSAGLVSQIRSTASKTQQLKGISGSGNALSRPPAREPEPIDVDRQNSDPIDMIAGEHGVFTVQHRILDQAPSDPFGSKAYQDPLGQPTQFTKGSQSSHATGLIDDPIETDFGSISQSGRQHRTVSNVNVQSMVRQFEMRTPFPLRDASKKAKMRPKLTGQESNTPSGNQFPLGKKPGPEAHNLGKPPKKKVPIPEVIHLPLTLWYCGAQIRDKMEEDADPVAWLLLEGSSLVVKKPPAAAQIRIPLNSISHIKHCGDQPPLIIQLKPNSVEAKELRSDHFMPGSNTPCGEITFVFHTDHPKWRFAAYSDLVKALKRSGIDDEKLSLGGGKAAVEMAALTAAPPKTFAETETSTEITTSQFYGKGSSSHILRRPIHNKDIALNKSRQSSIQSGSPPAPRRSSRNPNPTDKSTTTSNSTSTVAYQNAEEMYEPAVFLPPNIDRLLESVLVYPPSGTGAINITNGDLMRLDPNEFLNDTLIEFGLKIWLDNLRKENQALANQIHAFNSFFYKKLNVKNSEDGYHSVRKWTAKFDLFKKKYIIVPINEHLHWYLAIICNPEYVLQPPPASPEPKHTRSQHRKSGESETVSDPDSTKDPTLAIEVQLAASSIRERQIPTTSRSILTVENTITVSDSADSDDERKEVERDVEPMGLEEVNLVSDSPSPASPGLRYPESPMDIDSSSSDEPHKLTEPIVPPAQQFHDVIQESPNEIDSIGDEEPQVVNPVKIELPAELGRRRGKPQKASTVYTASIPQSHILIFDSLGSRHPQAHRVLQQYLVKEANDKKQLPASATSPALLKTVRSPQQPNFCDCGVYLLHFVETFMKNHDEFMKLIHSREFNDRHEIWDQSVLGHRREKLRETIKTLANEWKQSKQGPEPIDKGKGKAIEPVEDHTIPMDEDPKPPTEVVVVDIDDDEPIITGEARAAKKKPSAPKARPASRPRG